ncbi:helix-hairpin-helix domain-containing protein [Pseudomonas sp. PCH446]
MPGLVQLLAIPGLGPKRVQHLYQELGIQTLEQLSEAASQGRIRHLRGFGAETENRLLKAAQGSVGERRLPLAWVAPLAQRLCEYLQDFPGCGPPPWPAACVACAIRSAISICW